MQNVIFIKIYPAVVVSHAMFLIAYVDARQILCFGGEERMSKCDSFRRLYYVEILLSIVLVAGSLSI